VASTSVDSSLEAATVKRYYFHLVDGHNTIRDRDGIDVADLAEACAETIETVYEFRRDHSATAPDWTNWQTEVTDASGAIALTLNLSDLACRQVEVADASGTIALISA
jgi:hypothetical protein